MTALYTLLRLLCINKDVFQSICESQINLVTHGFDTQVYVDHKLTIDVC